MSTSPDPRPLTGEPVSLDLLNTRWNHEGVVRDLLTGTEGLAVWLAGNGLDFPADDTVLRHTLEARDALRAVIDAPRGRATGRAGPRATGTRRTPAPASRRKQRPASTPSSRTGASG